MTKVAVGYQAFIEKYALRVVPHYRQSFIALQGRGSIHIAGYKEIHLYPKTYALGNPDDSFEQLEFALKYDGVNLEILNAIFHKIDLPTFQANIAAHPNSKYGRILWFLYEFLSEKKLSLPDIKKLKYIDILDAERYFTSNGIKSKRHGVNNNLLGNKDFCPFIRKTKLLMQHIDNHYDTQATTLAQSYGPQIIARASHYLYTKETLSSYEIEREKPGKERLHKFINLLQQSHKIETLTKELLIEVQNAIVDPRFKDSDYRVNQNYIGENINRYLQKIHYISPKAENLNVLMAGLLATFETSKNTDLHPVILATIIAFGFVFIHPFEDGNGRLHRFLIHYILSKKNYTPLGVIFPISAVMLQNIHEYDQALEVFSKPIMNLIDDYQLSMDGILSVSQETLDYYSFVDYTTMAEYLFSCIQKTLHEHFKKEIELLYQYDKTKTEIQGIIDMPDKMIDLFIKCILQNQGKLSTQKKTKYFQKLTDKEIEHLCKIVNTHMLLPK